MASQVASVAFLAALSAQRKLYIERKAHTEEANNERRRSIGIEVVRQLQSRARAKTDDVSNRDSPRDPYISTVSSIPPRTPESNVHTDEVSVSSTFGVEFDSRKLNSPGASKVVLPASPIDRDANTSALRNDNIDISPKAGEKKRRGGEIVALDVTFGRKPPLHPMHSGQSEGAGERDLLEMQRLHTKDIIDGEDSIMGDRVGSIPKSVSSIEGGVYTTASRLAQRRRLSSGGGDSNTSAVNPVGLQGRSTPGTRRRESRFCTAAAADSGIDTAIPPVRQISKRSNLPSYLTQNPSASSSQPNPTVLSQNVAEPPLPSYAGSTSNKKLIANALTYVSLAGGPFEEIRNSVLAVLRSHSANHFYVALRRFKFVGLYVPFQTSQEATEEALQTNVSGDDLSTGAKAVRIFGEGPLYLHDTSIDAFYKYDSAGKQWKPVHAYGLNPSIDAVNVIPQQARRRAAAAAAAAAAATFPEDQHNNRVDAPVVLGSNEE